MTISNILIPRSRARISPLRSPDFYLDLINGSVVFSELDGSQGMNFCGKFRIGGDGLFFLLDLMIFEKIHSLHLEQDDGGVIKVIGCLINKIMIASDYYGCSCEMDAVGRGVINGSIEGPFCDSIRMRNDIPALHDGEVNFECQRREEVNKFYSSSFSIEMSRRDVGCGVSVNGEITRTVIMFPSSNDGEILGVKMSIGHDEMIFEDVRGGILNRSPMIGIGPGRHQEEFIFFHGNYDVQEIERIGKTILFGEGKEVIPSELEWWDD